MTTRYRVGAVIPPPDPEPSVPYEKTVTAQIRRAEAKGRVAKPELLFQKLPLFPIEFKLVSIIGSKV